MQGVANRKGARPKLLAGGFESLQLDDSTLTKYRKGEHCQDVYTLGKVLGKGGYATVRHGMLPSQHAGKPRSMHVAGVSAAVKSGRMRDYMRSLASVTAALPAALAHHASSTCVR